MWPQSMMNFAGGKCCCSTVVAQGMICSDCLLEWPRLFVALVQLESRFFKMTKGCSFIQPFPHSFEEVTHQAVFVWFLDR